ncbi:MAG: DUF1934 domain-containing protein [Clostridiales bacterium]|nr:DUF1934 domain-containing protein [Clostridiales bacterium]
MKILNKNNFAIKISGKHYFACDYIFSNVYGESVFTDDAEESSFAEEPSFSLQSMPSMLSDEESDSLLEDTLPFTRYDELKTMPDCTKKVEFITEGSLINTDSDGLFIRYGDDESPMCVHIYKDGTVTLSGSDSDVAEIVFEEGKRNYIALEDSAFLDIAPPPKTEDSEDAMHSPISLCVDTSEINNKMSEHGGSLSVKYSIEINGMIAEVSSFTITASSIGPEHKN